jgi:hypothetical protein
MGGGQVSKPTDALWQKLSDTSEDLCDRLIGGLLVPPHLMRELRALGEIPPRPLGPRELIWKAYHDGCEALCVKYSLPEQVSQWNTDGKRIILTTTYGDGLELFFDDNTVLCLHAEHCIEEGGESDEIHSHCDWEKYFLIMRRAFHPCGNFAGNPDFDQRARAADKEHRALWRWREKEFRRLNFLELKAEFEEAVK